MRFVFCFISCCFLLYQYCFLFYHIICQEQSACRSGISSGAHSRGIGTYSEAPRLWCAGGTTQVFPGAGARTFSSAAHSLRICDVRGHHASFSGRWCPDFLFRRPFAKDLRCAGGTTQVSPGAGARTFSSGAHSPRICDVRGAPHKFPRVLAPGLSLLLPTH